MTQDLASSPGTPASDEEFAAYVAQAERTLRRAQRRDRTRQGRLLSALVDAGSFFGDEEAVREASTEEVKAPASPFLGEDKGSAAETRRAEQRSDSNWENVIDVEDFRLEDVHDGQEAGNNDASSSRSRPPRDLSAQELQRALHFMRLDVPASSTSSGAVTPTTIPTSLGAGRANQDMSTAAAYRDYISQFSNIPSLSLPVPVYYGEQGDDKTSSNDPKTPDSTIESQSPPSKNMNVAPDGGDASSPENESPRGSKSSSAPQGSKKHLNHLASKKSAGTSNSEGGEEEEEWEEEEWEEEEWEEEDEEDVEDIHAESLPQEEHQENSTPPTSKESAPGTPKQKRSVSAGEKQETRKSSTGKPRSSSAGDEGSTTNRGASVRVTNVKRGISVTSSLISVAAGSSTAKRASNVKKSTVSGMARASTGSGSDSLQQSVTGGAKKNTVVAAGTATRGSTIKKTSAVVDARSSKASARSVRSSRASKKKSGRQSTSSTKSGAPQRWASLTATSEHRGPVIMREATRATTAISDELAIHVPPKIKVELSRLPPQYERAGCLGGSHLRSDIHMSGLTGIHHHHPGFVAVEMHHQENLSSGAKKQGDMPQHLVNEAKQAHVRGEHIFDHMDHHFHLQHFNHMAMASFQDHCRSKMWLRGRVVHPVAIFRHICFDLADRHRDRTSERLHFDVIRVAPAAVGQAAFKEFCVRHAIHQAPFAHRHIWDAYTATSSLEHTRRVHAENRHDTVRQLTRKGPGLPCALTRDQAERLADASSEWADKYPHYMSVFLGLYQAAQRVTSVSPKVTLQEFCPVSARKLFSFRNFLVAAFGSVYEFWLTVYEEAIAVARERSKSDPVVYDTKTVPKKAFLLALEILAYGAENDSNLAGIAASLVEVSNQNTNVNGAARGGGEDQMEGTSKITDAGDGGEKKGPRQLARVNVNNRQRRDHIAAAHEADALAEHLFDLLALEQTSYTGFNQFPVLQAADFLWLEICFQQSRVGGVMLVFRMLERALASVLKDGDLSAARMMLEKASAERLLHLLCEELGANPKISVRTGDFAKKGAFNHNTDADRHNWAGLASGSFAHSHVDWASEDEMEVRNNKKNKQMNIHAARRPPATFHTARGDTAEVRKAPKHQKFLAERLRLYATRRLACGSGATTVYAPEGIWTGDQQNDRLLEDGDTAAALAATQAAGAAPVGEGLKGEQSNENDVGLSGQQSNGVPTCAMSKNKAQSSQDREIGGEKEADILDGAATDPDGWFRVTLRDRLSRWYDEEREKNRHVRKHDNKNEKHNDIFLSHHEKGKFGFTAKAQMMRQHAQQRLSKVEAEKRVQLATLRKNTLAEFRVYLIKTFLTECGLKIWREHLDTDNVGHITGTQLLHAVRGWRGNTRALRDQLSMNGKHWITAYDLFPKQVRKLKRLRDSLQSMAPNLMELYMQMDWQNAEKRGFVSLEAWMRFGCRWLDIDNEDLHECFSQLAYSRTRMRFADVHYLFFGKWTTGL
ncbi:unnamed protein product [Amoebophrya sp. A25]|nr:unnamed protein product [Amoebophrya sp. A25]|eukprot:GSA25T00010513001.1